VGEAGTLAPSRNHLQWVNALLATSPPATGTVSLSNDSRSKPTPTDVDIDDPNPAEISTFQPEVIGLSAISFAALVTRLIVSLKVAVVPEPHGRDAFTQQVTAVYPPHPVTDYEEYREGELSSPDKPFEADLLTR